MRPTPRLAARVRTVQPTRGRPFKNDHYDQPAVPLRADWHPINIHNLYQRNNGGLKDQYDFSRSRDSLHKIFAACKAALRAYWMPSMKDYYFRKWYLPNNLPVVHPTAISSPTMVPSAKSITKWTRPGKEGGRHAVEAHELHEYLGSQAPTGPLMFREIERRLDHVVFRGGFADSVETARGMIGSGAVRLNGNVETQRHVRLLPGDFLEINPSSIPFLARPPLDHVALAQPSSSGIEYARGAGLRAVLVDLVGCTPAQADKALERKDGSASRLYERWLAEGGRFFGRDMKGPLEQDVVRAVLGEEVTEESVRKNDDDGLTLRERRQRRAEALLTPEELAIARSQEGAEAGGLFLTDADEPSPRAADAASLAVRSNAGVKLTPAHFPALPSDPSGTRDFHLPPFSSPQLFIPAYLQPNFRFCTLAYIRHPTARHNANELPSPFDAGGAVVRRAWEWYHARKMRRRVHAGGLYPGGMDARARNAYLRRGPDVRRTGVHEDMY